MYRQNVLLSLLLVSFMLSSHADPVTEKGCIEDDSDNIGKFKRIKSDGQCRQPFEATFVAGLGTNYWIYTESTSDPIDESIIQYSFSDCKLRLKVHNKNNDLWFELLDAGSDSGKRIEPGFRIHLHEPMGGKDTMMVKKKDDETPYYQTNCDLFAGFGDGKTMNFKQEVMIGDPNIALILYKQLSYFGRVHVENPNFFGELPPHLSTSTKAVSTTTSMASSTASMKSSAGSSSTKAISSSTSSSFKASSTVATIPSETAAEEKGMEPWLIGVIVGVPVLLMIIIAVIIAVICIVRRRKKKEKPQVVDVVFKTEETMTRETTLGGEAAKSKKKSKESNKSVSKSLFGSMEKA